MNKIETLEHRVLHSASTVTAAQLTADKAAIAADSISLKADAKTAFGNDKVDTKFIAAAFDTLPTSEQALFKSFESSATKNGTSVSSDVAGLLTSSTGLVAKSTAAGIAALKKATTGTLTPLLKDITQLDLITAEPVSKLQSVLSSTDLTTARDLILAAFPEDSAIINAVYEEAIAAATGNSTILTDATKYQTDVATLAADLTTVRDDLATYPALVGSFTGTATPTNGPTKGEPVSSTIAISTEDTATGAVTGTVTDVTTGGTDSVTGTVSLNGVLSLKTVAGSATKGTVSGFVVGTTIIGKFKLGSTAGLFSLNQIVT